MVEFTEKDEMAVSNSLVSIIIPAFNCGLFITETLESAYRQTYTNWEIIVIDDGSTDNTRTVLDPHMDKIHYFYQSNCGTAAARNAGIRKAKGNYIAFLDNDDLWLPEKLELQVMALQKYPECGLVFTDGQLFRDSEILNESLISNKILAGLELGFMRESLIMGSFLYDQLFFGNVIASASSVMLRGDCLRRVGGFDESLLISDDFDLWLRIAHLYPLVMIRKCLYKWRYREDSQSGPMQGRSQVYTQALIPVLKKHLHHVPNSIRKTIRAKLAHMYWDCGWRLFNQNRIGDSRRMVFHCLWYPETFLRAFVFLILASFGQPLVEKMRQIKRTIRRNPLATLAITKKRV